MCLLVGFANYGAQFPIHFLDLQDFLTLGAIAYPFTFLVNDLTNRFYGAKSARRLIWVVFPFALILTLILGTPARIAFASLTAFLLAQLLDVYVFQILRDKRPWWLAPLSSSIAASILDTVLFFGLAFYGATGWANYGGLDAPIWVGWTVGDIILKALFALFILIPYRIVLGHDVLERDPRAVASHQKD